MAKKEALEEKAKSVPSEPEEEKTKSAESETEDEVELPFGAPQPDRVVKVRKVTIVKKVIKKPIKKSKKVKAKRSKSGPRMKSTESKVESPATTGFIVDNSPEAKKLLEEYNLGPCFNVTQDKNIPSFYSDLMFKLISENRTLSSLDELKEKVVLPMDNEFGESTFTVSSGKQPKNFNIVC